MSRRRMGCGSASLWTAVLALASTGAAYAGLSVFPASPAITEDAVVTIESPPGQLPICSSWRVSDRRLHTLELEGTPLPSNGCPTQPPQVNLGRLELGHYAVTAHLAGSTAVVGEVRFDVQPLAGPPARVFDLGFSNPTPREGEPFAITFSVAHYTCDGPVFDAPPKVLGDVIVIDGSLGLCGILPIPLWQADGFRFDVPGLTAGTKTVEIHDGGTTVRTFTFHVDADATSLLSFGGQIETTVRWTDHAGVAHDAHATSLSDTSGQFWFFAADTPEVTVKWVDGTSLNGAYWVFLSSLTDLGFTVKVRSVFCSFSFCVIERTYTQLPGHNRNFIDLDVSTSCVNCSP